MKIGCCTWIFGGEPLAVTATRVKRAGLDGVELFGDVSLDPKVVLSLLGDHGLAVFSLTPGDADISHPDAAVRDQALDYYRRLVDFAAALGGPLISCHGQVTRIAPIASQAEEDAHLIASTRAICDMAAAQGQNVVFEILNRYETHQIRTVAEGLVLLDQVGAENLKLLPDAYHMNIEERDPAAALRRAGNKLGLYHAADSNREGIGDGHIDFPAQFAALRDIGYDGPVIMETNAPGPNPFSTDKGAGVPAIIEAQLKKSADWLRTQRL
ncbi:hypothetical protein P775_24850 [Puniceibacterium antarcticum]|uniref:Xylose isomerase-like TIM barrel domain-containing protein n=1 Tax=Puniceibacterium antarcticum TaxID=1206336 RepID=A0A2G8R7N5_9RHOB|nr:sugar phosphate isomerase/epimerase family protein [Puniceibacterium antarcticum]PIL17158.1 hypothetical protein P775_24850 [Puniceibacterium antarcticum]